MKKKNGFTLIELLVVIALMLSILGPPIVLNVTVLELSRYVQSKNTQNLILLLTGLQSL